MIFDFQHEMPSGRWSDLGVSELPDEIFSIELAFRELKAQLGGVMPEGRCRFRVVDGEEHWGYGEVDRQGRLRLDDS